MRSIIMLSLFNIVNSPYFLFITISVSLLLKCILLTWLIPQAFRVPAVQKTCIFLILVLAGSIAGELAWEIKLLRLLFTPLIPYPAIIFFVRIAWAFLVPQYQALGLFLDSLTHPKFALNWFQKIILPLTSCISLIYLYLAFFDSTTMEETTRLYALGSQQCHNVSYEIILMRHVVHYILALLILPNLFFCLKKIRANILPKILNHQLSIIIKYVMMPYLATELLLALHFDCPSLKPYTNAIVGTSALLITYIVYRCIVRIMGMRFLNFTTHVESEHNADFVDHFKIILEQLSLAKSIQELEQITNNFFKQMFGISQSKICFYIPGGSHEQKAIAIEAFCSSTEQEIARFLTENKILIYDELAFSNFYQERAIYGTTLAFLTTIDADIFLPIWNNNHLLASIIIRSGALPHTLYNACHRDQMIIFAQYVGNILKLLQNHNLETLMHQEKELQEELYKKNQEIKQYKESIRSFLTLNKEKEIGILFYKNRRLICANQTAKELLQANPNVEHGHPVVKTIRRIARQVYDYKQPSTAIAMDLNGKRYTISGVLNLDQNAVIITVSKPDIGEIIAQQTTMLKDPSVWDYILYLETTKPGQLINRLIPGNGETLLPFKIDLLQTALSKKATLLELPKADLFPLVELLHHISTREKLEVLSLKEDSNLLMIASTLFGVNPIFNLNPPEKSLLARLHDIGTLFIEDVQHLPLELQEYLAEFLKLGYYRIYKSEGKRAANVRIICSTTVSLEKLVEEKKFSPLLMSELKKCVLSMPSISQLPEGELTELAKGYSEQATGTSPFNTLLGITTKEYQKIVENRPMSFKELQERIEKLISQKSKKGVTEQEVHHSGFDQIQDPDLLQASKLGKNALRDPRLMTTLWHTFKNQNKIAAFLGVNRSSVNRRCKAYNLEP